jgi:hypothetical protein
VAKAIRSEEEAVIDMEAIDLVLGVDEVVRMWELKFWNEGRIN